MKESQEKAPASRLQQRCACCIALPGIIVTIGFGLVNPGVHPTGPGARPSGYIVEIEESGPPNPNSPCRNELAYRSAGRLWGTTLTDDPTMRYHLAALSPDGRFVAFSGTRMDADSETPVEQGLYVGDLPYSRPGRPECLENIEMVAPLQDGAMILPDLAWTPDSRYVVFAIRMPVKHSVGQCDIFLYRPGTGEVRNLTGTPDVGEFCPMPSPQSDRVAFMRPVRQNNSRRYDIFTVAITGGPPRRITHPSNTTSLANTYPKWTPDGAWLVFQDTVKRRWRIPADGSGRAALLPSDA